MKRSKFSLSNYKLLSCDMGELIPCGWFEVLPGDTIQMATSALVRAAPMLAPVMHPVQVRIHHWFVPNRLVWSSWENFITGGPDGANASVPPYIGPINGAIGTVAVGSIWDYMGVPPGTYPANNVTISAIPFRAYNLIWNEFYRDQDLDTALPVPKTDGQEVITYALQNCSWEKDYFTSARPWEQKGPSVTIPIGGSAPITAAGDFTLKTTIDGINRQLVGQNTSNVGWSGTPPTGGASQYVSGLSVNLSGATPINVTQFRTAMALQRYEEMRARFGSRYTEYLRALGVKSSDARLQRPEYLGGGKQTIQFSEVLQTGPEAGGTGVGKMKGHGIGAMRSNRFQRFFEEHGIVMSLMSIKPRTMYASGLERKFSRSVKEDYWQRELQHIGQQKVLQKEVYAVSANAANTFGWQDRYDEYRRQESTIAGDFRSVLDFWHMARVFTSDPALNSAFVKCVPTERTFAVPSEDVMYVMASHRIRARRLVAQVGTSFIM